MYLTCGIPCSDCARGIINSGIKKIVCERVGGAVGNLWDEHAKRSVEMFNEAGVKIEYYEM
jgi:deoxycytidylate deaminase